VDYDSLHAESLVSSLPHDVCGIRNRDKNQFLTHDSENDDKNKYDEDTCLGNTHGKFSAEPLIFQIIPYNEVI
jgi:hypothetical protein